MKRTWVQDPDTGQLTLKKAVSRDTQQFASILPTIEPFVSPVDGSIISDRSHLRTHNKRHEVTNVADYGPDWFDRRGKEKYNEQQGKTPQQRRERREAINRTMRERGI